MSDIANMEKPPPRPPVKPVFAEAFIRDAGKSAAALEAFMEKTGAYGEDELRAYVIHAHGMKGALANVGNTGLSQAALKLEMAGRGGDVETITAGTPAFLRALRSYAEELKPETDGEGAPEGDIDLLRQALLEIKAACEVYDEESAGKAAARLKERTWPQPAEAFLDGIPEKLLHSEFDEIADAAGRFLETLLPSDDK